MPDEEDAIIRQAIAQNIGQIKAQQVPRATHKRWKGNEVHTQEQSHLAGRLPAEVRNLIYAYLWEGSGAVTEAGEDVKQPVVETSKEVQNEGVWQQDADEVAKKAPHPLSLLSTCRKIYLDAALFAYSNHTFTIPELDGAATYLALSRLTSPLPELLFNSISRLAYGTPPATPYVFIHHTLYVTHSLLLFPSLRHLEIRMYEDRFLDRRLIHDKDPSVTRARIGSYLKPQKQKPQFVPQWLHEMLDDVLNGRVYVWQKGEKWSVQWPQEEDSECAHIAMMHNTRFPIALEGKLTKRYPGIDPTLMSPCVCGCGAPCWYSASLVQETGRPPVSLQVRYDGDRRTMELRNHKLQLIPRYGLAGPTSALVGRNERMMGFGFDAEGTEFWKRRKAKASWRAAAGRWWRGEGT
ncbi:hypothetical protein SLS60_003771 [Paraconiothyrium brasiliense]|uniref:DUF7730 domain-containing protein n=1 Tax=Paraconiothyrium brasiliense TaxID=300254 RepID=A0ABR3RPK5_9PLEO